MENREGKIKSFQDLNSWKLGHQVVLNIYKLTKRFPKLEIFGLVSQIRRASVSVTSNIAEGFGRISIKEKIRFYQISMGSINEIKNQLLISRDLYYINNEEYLKIEKEVINLSKLLNGLIKSTKKRL